MVDSDGRESSIQKQQQYGPASGYTPDDEISLVDLWLVLVRRKWWVIGVAIAVTGFSLAYALMQPDIYQYRQAVEIGSRIVDGETRSIEKPSSVVDGETRPIEKPSSVAAKLNEGVIPSETYDWAQSADTEWRPSIEASAPQGARMVILESEGTSSRQEPITQLMERVSDRLTDDHKRVTQTVREQIAADVTSLRNEIEEAESERKRLRSRIKRLDEREGLIEAEITNLQEVVTNLEAHRREVSESFAGATEAMALLTLSSEERQSRQRISELRTQLRVDLPDMRDDLKGSIAEQSRRLESARAEIGAKQSQIDNLSITKAASPPRRSSDPVNSSASLIVALGGVLGLMLGLFSALFAQFLSRVKEEASLRHDESADSTEAKR